MPNNTLCSQPPTWYSTSINQSTPSSQEIYSYGTGNTPIKAINNARNNLLLIIQKKLTENDTLTGISQKVDTETIKEHLIQSFSKIEIKKKEKKDTAYYVLVSLNKKKYLNNLSKKIKKNEKKITKINKKAQFLISEKKIAEALSILNSSYIEEKMNNLYRYVFKVLSEKEIDSTLHPQKIHESIEYILKESRISIIDGDDQYVKMGDTLDQVTLLVTFEQKPAEGLPIVIKKNNKRIITSGKSDINGTIIIPKNTLKIDKNEDTFDAHISFEKNKIKWKKNSLSTKINYKISEAPYSHLSLSIPDSVSTLNKQRLFLKIKSFGINIKNNSDIEITANLNTTSTMIQSGTQTTHFSKSTWTFSDKNINNKGNILSITKTGISNNKAESWENSQKKIPLEKEKFFEFLTKSHPLKKQFLH
jgi:hypothetical protein